MSSDRFISEFRQFLNLPIAEQLLILPTNYPPHHWHSQINDYALIEVEITHSIKSWLQVRKFDPRCTR